MTPESEVKPIREDGKPVGLAAFETLRAEDELWLTQHAYVLPPEFDLMAGARSIIVYGQPGSGKTALRCALEHHATSSAALRLIAHWRPTLSASTPTSGIEAARAQFAQVMDACSMALLNYLAHSVAAFRQAPDWAQQKLAWFIQRYAGHDLAARTAPLLDKADNPGRALLRKLIAQPTPGVLATDASVDAVIAQWTEALRLIGINGVWVMADGVEGLAEIEPDRLSSALAAFLSSLAYFEQAPFFYKLTLPLSLQARLNASGGVGRLRVFPHQLQWPPDLLRQMVERRIAWATGDNDFKLTDLYLPPVKPKQKSAAHKLHPVQAWLAGCGGPTPRGWLAFASPLASAYLELRSRGQSRPLTRDEWLSARSRTPLSLSIDEQSGLVQVGWRVAGRLTPLELTVLNYLASKRGQICSKEELYDNAYLAPNTLSANQSSRPKTGAQPVIGSRKRKGKTTGYANVMDTVLNRLREVIEPDMEDPVFLLTYRGQGVELRLQPFG